MIRVAGSPLKKVERLLLQLGLHGTRTGGAFGGTNVAPQKSGPIPRADLSLELGDEFRVRPTSLPSQYSEPLAFALSFLFNPSLLPSMLFLKRMFKHGVHHIWQLFLEPTPCPVRADGKITTIRECVNPVIYAKALGLKVG